MPLGIRPIVDLAFKLTFGSEENKIALISLLNAILNLASPIVDVTLLNPFNRQDFAEDKLSVVDVRAADQSGALYDIEMQLEVSVGLTKRLVFYGCELYAGQLKKGQEYFELRPVYTICLTNELLWTEGKQGHHVFHLSDRESGRILDGTLEVHTVELPRYNSITAADLKTASLLECWVFWLLHAQDYEPEALMKLLPQAAFQKATQAIAMIAQKTEDKAMYDSREKALRDHHWAISAARLEGKIEGETKGKIEGEIEGEIKGKIKGKIEMIQMLERLLLVPVSPDVEFRGLNLEQLEALSSNLQERLRNRTPS